MKKYIVRVRRDEQRIERIERIREIRVQQITIEYVLLRAAEAGYLRYGWVRWKSD